MSFFEKDLNCVKRIDFVYFLDRMPRITYGGHTVFLVTALVVHFLLYAIVRKTIPNRVERLEFEA